MTDKLTISPDLLSFLKRWLAWAEGDALDDSPYFRDEGLCDGIQEDYYKALISDAERYSLRRELRNAFEAGGLCRRYPFGAADFVLRTNTREQHLCPKRLAWVRSVIARCDTNKE